TEPSMKKRYIILLFLLIMTLTVIILANTKLDGYLRNKITTAVLTETDSTYHLEMESLDVSFFPIHIFIDQLSFTPKDSTYIYLDSTASVLANINIERVEIRNFDWSAYLFSNKLKGSVILEQPDINLVMRKEAGARFASESVDSRKALLIRKIEVTNGTLRYRDEKEKLDVKFNTTLTEVTHETSSAKLINSLALNATKLDYTDPSGLYGLSCDSLNYSGEQTSLVVSGMEYRTLTGRSEISRIMGHQKSWYDLDFPLLEISGNGESFMKYDELFISEVKATKPNVTVYSDGRFSRQGVPHKEMPDEMIAAISFPLMIQKLTVTEGHISYETHSKMTDALGQLTFTELTIDADSLTNTLPRQPFMINASARIMGAGLVEVELKIPQSKEAYPYLVRGSIQPMQLTKINPIFYPVSGKKIASGVSEDSYFTFTHDEKASTGNMRFYYDDLKVDFPNGKEDGFFKKIGSSLKSAIANTLVVNTDSEEEDEKTGDIAAERDLSQFVLGFWWRSLLSGLMDTMK
ncbi:MAG: hypothetical protein WBA74_10070, partial [Cyclobacteriaceae bacterium]